MTPRPRLKLIALNVHHALRYWAWCRTYGIKV